MNHFLSDYENLRDITFLFTKKKKKRFLFYDFIIGCHAMAVNKRKKNLKEKVSRRKGNILLIEWFDRFFY